MLIFNFIELVIIRFYQLFLDLRVLGFENLSIF